MIVKEGDYDKIMGLGYYIPKYHWVLYPNSFSLKILDVKFKKNSSYEFFLRIFDKILTYQEFTICTVPPSQASITNQNGIAELGRRILQIRNNAFDGINTLTRKETTDPSHKCNNRSLEKHLSTIELNDPTIIKGQKILLLDDVKTTGNTLNACKKMLTTYSKEIQCLVLGITYNSINVSDYCYNFDGVKI